MGPDPRVECMTLLQFLAATAIVTTGSVLQGTIGFGLALLSAPLLLLVDPLMVPGPLLCSSGLLTLLLARREWYGVRRADLGWALGGRVVGTLVAVGVLSLITSRTLDLLVGVTVVAAVALTASGLHPVPGPRTLAGAGMLSGFMGTTTSIGGPPMALIYQRETGPRLRGTLSAFFVVGVVLSLGALWWVDRFGMVELRLAGALVPGTLAGFWLSRHTAAGLEERYLRPAVLVVSGVAGVVVLVRQLLG